MSDYEGCSDFEGQMSDYEDDEDSTTCSNALKLLLVLLVAAVAAILVFIFYRHLRPEGYDQYFDVLDDQVFDHQDAVGDFFESIFEKAEKDEKKFDIEAKLEEVTAEIEELMGKSRTLDKNIETIAKDFQTAKISKWVDFDSANMKSALDLLPIISDVRHSLTQGDNFKLAKELFHLTKQEQALKIIEEEVKLNSNQLEKSPPRTPNGANGEGVEYSTEKGASETADDIIEKVKTELLEKEKQSEKLSYESKAMLKRSIVSMSKLKRLLSLFEATSLDHLSKKARSLFQLLISLEKAIRDGGPEFRRELKCSEMTWKHPNSVADNTLKAYFKIFQQQTTNIVAKMNDITDKLIVLKK